MALLRIALFTGLLSGCVTTETAAPTVAEASVKPAAAQLPEGERQASVESLTRLSADLARHYLTLQEQEAMAGLTNELRLDIETLDMFIAKASNASADARAELLAESRGFVTRTLHLRRMLAALAQKSDEGLVFAHAVAAAELGNQTAVTFIAERILEGGVLGPEAGELVVGMFHRAAVDGKDTSSQFVLGMMYLFGKAVKKDEAKAAEWFLMAAELGHADSQYMLGMVLAKGSGVVAQDQGQAKKWLEKAAAAGHPDASAMLRLLAH
jgi:hypothetical protein